MVWNIECLDAGCHASCDVLHTYYMPEALQQCGALIKIVFLSLPHWLAIGCADRIEDV